MRLISLVRSSTVIDTYSPPVSLFYSNCDALSCILRLQIDVYDKYQSADAVLIIFALALFSFQTRRVPSRSQLIYEFLFGINNYFFLLRVS